MRDGMQGTASAENGPPEAVLAGLRAVLGDVSVNRVPIGHAIATAFVMPDGDGLAVYLSGPDPDGRWTLVDDGTRLSMLEASGFSGPAAEAVVDRLVRAHGAGVDREAMEVFVGPVPDSGVGPASASLIAVLLGLHGLSMLDWTIR